ncbi:unnamed protein product [Rhizoctonia solani]|uniref:Uncharacterized protein n=1 Tax=Rhizoctonia solani TaxID=456999 RepID=A0A8H2WFS0_9AGAM|nr:unnamed protein product [Rhizoctonia solani]
MSTALVTHLMPLAVLLAVLATLFSSTTQGSQRIDSIISTTSFLFWELIVGPFILLIFCPLLFVATVLTLTVTLPVAALVLTLVTTTFSTSPFYRFLNLVTTLFSLVGRTVAGLGARAASTITSPSTLGVMPLFEHKRDFVFIPKVHGHPISSEQLETPIYFLKKRRPINYSRSRRSIPLNRLDVTYARLTAHIERVRSNNLQTESSKAPTAVARGPTLASVTDATPPTTQGNKSADIVISSPVLASSSIVEANVRTAEPRVEPSTLDETLEQEYEQSDTPIPASPQLSEATAIEVKINLTNIERAPSPANCERPVSVSETPMLPEQDVTIALPLPETHSKSVTEVEREVNSAPISTFTHTESFSTTAKLLVACTVPVYDIAIDTFTPPTEQAISFYSTPLTEEQHISLPYYVSEPVDHTTAGLIFKQHNPAVTNHIVTETSIANGSDAATSNHTDNLQQHNISMSTPPRSTEVAQPDSTSSQAIHLFFDTESYLTQTNQPLLDGVLCDQSSSGLLIPDDLLQTAMEMITTPEFQDALTEIGQLVDSLVDAPPTSGMSAPLNVDEQSQLHMCTSPDHSPVALPTDEELLTLAAAAIAENVDGTILVDQGLTIFDPNSTNTGISSLDSSQLELLDHATRLVMADLDLSCRTPGSSGTPSLNNLTTLDFVDTSGSELHTDPNELARMWNDLGASLQDWAAQVPGAMDFSQEDMTRMFMELGALDTICSPVHIPIEHMFMPVLPIPAPTIQPRRIKKLPLRRRFQNNAQARAA